MSRQCSQVKLFWKKTLLFQEEGIHPTSPHPHPHHTVLLSRCDRYHQTRGVCDLHGHLKKNWISNEKYFNHPW